MSSETGTSPWDDPSKPDELSVHVTPDDSEWFMAVD